MLQALCRFLLSIISVANVSRGFLGCQGQKENTSQHAF